MKNFFVFYDSDNERDACPVGLPSSRRRTAMEIISKNVAGIISLLVVLGAFPLLAAPAAETPPVQGQPPASGEDLGVGGGTAGAGGTGAGLGKEKYDETGKQTKEHKCDERNNADCRDDLEATAYGGVEVDTFASSNVNNLLNPDATGKVKYRGIGGFDFAYRISGKPNKFPQNGRLGATGQEQGVSDDSSTRSNNERTYSRANQLWVYGESVYGARSSEINCKAHPTFPICVQSGFGTVRATADQTLYLLRNATSLEAFSGLRWEFLTLQWRKQSPANLYVKSQAGFLSVAGTTDDFLEDHIRIAVGGIVTKGIFQNSYLEFGNGRNDVFQIKRYSRLKVDAYLTWEVFGKKVGKHFRPFVQTMVDADLGHGPDSVRTYFGLEFDLMCLFDISSCKENENKARDEKKKN